jgi:hypothetical protein
MRLMVAHHHITFARGDVLSSDGEHVDLGDAQEPPRPAIEPLVADAGIDASEPPVDDRRDTNLHRFEGGESQHVCGEHEAGD